MKQRRTLFALALLCGATVFAQDASNSSQTKDESKTEFTPHWYMGIQAGAGFTRGEVKTGDLISPAAAIYGGYQFTPLWGLRAGISGWQGKGAWVSPRQDYKYNYLQGNVDATLDLGNLFAGYNERRVFNPYAFVGVGLNGAFNNDEAVALNTSGYQLEYLWKDNQFSVVGRAGLGANLRLSSKLYFNLEVNANVLSDRFNSKKAGNADWQFNALAGLTFKFGKKAKATPEVVSYEPAPVQPAPVVEEKTEPVVTQPTPVVQEKETMTENVYFLINSASIRTSEKEKIEKLVEFLRTHSELKVNVCGYADKNTGYAAYNKRLSKKRAEAVAKALKEAGISQERIIVDYKGDTVQPFSSPEQNRVSICVVE